MVDLEVLMCPRRRDIKFCKQSRSPVVPDGWGGQFKRQYFVRYVLVKREPWFLGRVHSEIIAYFHINEPCSKAWASVVAQ